MISTVPFKRPKDALHVSVGTKINMVEVRVAYLIPVHILYFNRFTLYVFGMYCLWDYVRFALVKNTWSIMIMLKSSQMSVTIWERCVESFRISNQQSAQIRAQEKKNTAPVIRTVSVTHGRLCVLLSTFTSHSSVSHSNTFCRIPPPLPFPRELWSCSAVAANLSGWQSGSWLMTKCQCNRWGCCLHWPVYIH